MPTYVIETVHRIGRIESGEGIYVTDASGRKLIDGPAGMWCVNAGHCRPSIVEAIRKPPEG